MKIKVLVFPKDDNPYQELLYRSMSDVTIRYVRGFTPSRTINTFLLPIELLYYRIIGYRILHLHWVYPFHLSSTNRLIMRVSEVLLSAFLTLIRTMNYKLVWTAHNIVPHERTFIDDHKMALYLASRADKVIFLNNYVADTFIRDLPEIRNKVSIITQGNYLEYYDFGKAKITKDKLVFGFVGQIKPYKGLHLLIPIIQKIKNPRIRLHIVGKCNDQSYLKKLIRLAKSDKRILIENRYIDHKDLGSVVASFGIVVLPFTSITNSSTAMLAFSASRPLISPLIGGMKDYPANTGFYYENRGGIEKAIRESITHASRWGILGSNAYKFALKNSWVDISKSTSRIYYDLVSSQA